MILLKRILIWLRNLFIFLFVFSLLWVVAGKVVPVYYTPLMFIRLYEQFQDGKPLKLKHTWVPMSKIAQPMVQAVISSEDNLFMEHRGLTSNRSRRPKMRPIGVSVFVEPAPLLSRLLKMFFYGPGKAISVKGIEAYFTVLIEWVWGKEE
jgi:monofunctional biosynthetic peptidoglycan transglycosylase